MRIVFVRHAKAMDRREFKGDNDLLRPLTEDGVKEARNVFKKLAVACKAPDLVLSSKALRAAHTAEIMLDAFGKCILKQSEVLNPGCNPAAFRKLLVELGKKSDNVAVVGHDPDFTDIISDLVAGGALSIAVKKGSWIEVEWDVRAQRGTLMLLITPGFIKAL
ncbi:MAG: histidine phosphatase family protein [Lentisphaerota bacterium]